MTDWMNVPRYLHKSMTEHKPSYWEYQIPIAGRVATARDNQRYWDDYYKNTGFRPRYPGRVYGNGAVTGTISEASSLYKNMKKIYG